MQFVYTAKTSSGDIQTGHISAPDVEAVKRALREQSLFVIDVRKKAGNTLWKVVFGARERSGLSKRDLLSVTTQLAIMTRSGVDLASAFQSLSQQCGNSHLRNILAQIHRDVTGGKSISDAMQAQAAVFGDAYVASVAAGEAAGKLPEYHRSSCSGW
jgi:type II secretory pathway component PulF